MVIEVDGLVAGVVTAGVDAIVDLPLFALGAAHFDVGHAQALAAGVVSAFALVGGRRAAPQKVFVHIIRSPPRRQPGRLVVCSELLVLVTVEDEGKQEGDAMPSRMQPAIWKTPVMLPVSVSMKLARAKMPVPPE